MNVKYNKLMLPIVFIVIGVLFMIFRGEVVKWVAMAFGVFLAIDGAITLSKTKRNDADLVESVCPCRRNPYFNMCKADGDFMTTVIDSNFTTRQEAPEIYDENASIYVLEAKFFADNDKNMLNEAKTVPYMMKDTAVLDIDSEEDFEMMGVVASYLFDRFPSYNIIRKMAR